MDALDLLRTKIREKMNDFADAIAMGEAKDFAEYKQMAGVIQGLATAERELLDIKEMVERGQD